MMTTKNAFIVETDEKPRTVQRSELDAVLKLQELQRNFLGGSEIYNKIQDIINTLNK